jgi:hypothetical protein
MDAREPIYPDDMADPSGTPGWLDRTRRADRGTNAACMVILREKAQEMLPAYAVRHWPRTAPMRTRALVEIVSDSSHHLLDRLEVDLWSTLDTRERQLSIAAAARERIFRFFHTVAHKAVFSLMNADLQPDPIVEIELFRQGLQEIFNHFTELRRLYVEHQSQGFFGFDE